MFFVGNTTLKPQDNVKNINGFCPMMEFYRMYKSYDSA